MNEYRITSKADEYVRRATRFMLICCVLSIPYGYWICWLMMRTSVNESIEFTSMHFLLDSVIVALTSGLMFGIYYTQKQVKRIVARKLIVRLDDSFIEIECRILNESGINFINKYHARIIESPGSGLNSKLKLDTLKSVKFKKKYLYVRSTESLSRGLFKTLRIPQEIDGFEEVKSILEAKLQSKSSS